MIHNIPDAPCMEYLPTFGWTFMVNVGKYSIHGASGIMVHTSKPFFTLSQIYNFHQLHLLRYSNFIHSRKKNTKSNQKTKQNKHQYSPPLALLTTPPLPASKHQCGLTTFLNLLNQNLSHFHRACLQATTRSPFLETTNSDEEIFGRKQTISLH